MGFVWFTNNIIPVLIIVVCVALIIAYICFVIVRKNKKNKTEGKNVTKTSTERKFVLKKETGEIQGMKEAKNIEKIDSIDDIINKL